MAKLSKYVFEPLTSTELTVLTSLSQLHKKTGVSISTLRRHLKNGVYYDPAGRFRIMPGTIEPDQGRVRAKNFRS